MADEDENVNVFDSEEQNPEQPEQSESQTLSGAETINSEENSDAESVGPVSGVTEDSEAASEPAEGDTTQASSDDSSQKQTGSKSSGKGKGGRNRRKKQQSKRPQSKELRAVKQLIETYREQNRGPAENTQKFVNILRHMLRNPKHEVVDEVFKMFTDGQDVIATNRFRTNIDNNYSEAIQWQLSFVYQVFTTAAKCLHQGRQFRMDPDQIRNKLQCDGVTDYIIEKMTDQGLM